MTEMVAFVHTRSSECLQARWGNSKKPESDSISCDCLQDFVHKSTTTATTPTTAAALTTTAAAAATTTATEAITATATITITTAAAASETTKTLQQQHQTIKTYV
jgi:hypothetical protein